MTVLTSPAFRTGGMFGSPKIDLGGCVLYLPFWRPDMAGSPIISKDSSAHSCTVVGATWGLTGRTFDGADDYITVPHNACFDFGTGDFSWVVWFKATTTASVHRILSKGDSEAFVVRINIDTIEAYVGEGTVTKFAFTDTASFHQLAITRTSGLVKVYLDLVEKFSGILAGNVDSATDLTIGIRHTLTEDFSGIVGEVSAYKRGRTLLEITQNYLATKWGYI